MKELLERARLSVAELEGAGRFDDRQILELIRLLGPGSASSLLVVIANELAMRLKLTSGHGSYRKVR